MGMYTELHFNSELKRDVPGDVIDILKYMLGELDECPELPENKLFNTSRWDYMLRCDSYYFDADTHSTLRFDDISDSYYLCIRSNVKNYEGEIEAFVDWVMPYLDKYDGQFLGFSRYEEYEIPHLIYYNEQKA